MNPAVVAARLPVPAYYRTFLWAKAMRRNPGAWPERCDWPYWNAIEAALLTVGRSYGTAYPKAAGYSMLEFGVAGGLTLERMLHFRDVQTRRLNITAPVTVYGFDTFEGMPEARDGDDALPYVPGDYDAGLAQVERRTAGYRDLKLVKGLFADTLPGYQQILAEQPPVFVSIDCDWYSSTIDVLDELVPVLPHGCVFYFDDAATNFFSTKTGEMRAIREVNEGRYGDHIELVEIPLHAQTGAWRWWKHLYRYIDVEKAAVQNTVLIDREPDMSLRDA